jgi:glycosyltransferase involved in cell wall biosynthesis
LASLTSVLVRFNFTLSHVVLVESLRLGNYKDLAPFHAKLYDGALYLDSPECFTPRIRLRDRDNVVGYIGRLVPGKGVVELVRAIPIALEQRPDLRFLIIGTGSLDEVVEKELRDQAWASRVTLIGWVKHEQVPDYLNQLKLMVMPSDSEGLPNVVLEAMSCGTPVLATPVGGIPDIIINGETGFLLADNGPTTIAKAIINALDDPRLEPIIQQGRALMESDFSLNAAAGRYRCIIDSATRGYKQLV